MVIQEIELFSSKYVYLAYKNCFVFRNIKPKYPYFIANTCVVVEWWDK